MVVALVVGMLHGASGLLLAYHNGGLSLITLGTCRVCGKQSGPLSQLSSSISVFPCQLSFISLQHGPAQREMHM